MTIGPEPMRRILLMSSRLGMGRLLRKTPLQIGAHAWPLGVDDRVVGGVPSADTGDQHGLAKDALVCRRKSLERGTRSLVAGLGLELDPQAAELVERIGEHQQVCVEVATRPPRGAMKPA